MLEFRNLEMKKDNSFVFHNFVLYRKCEVIIHMFIFLLLYLHFFKCVVSTETDVFCGGLL